MLTTGAPLQHARRTAAGRTAVICGEERFDYATLHERCARLASGLAGLGLRHGDRVAVLAAGCHRYVEAHLAVPAAGFVIVPLNTRHAEPELLDALRRSGARVLLTDRDPGPLGKAVEATVRFGAEYEALLAGAPLPAEASSPFGPTAGAAEATTEDHPAAIFFTGGTTGRSKGVVLTHRNLVANAFHKTLACSLEGADVLLAVAPLFHVAGTAPLLGLVWLGGTIVVLPSFDPAVSLDLIERHGVTVLVPVPTMVAAMVDEQGRRPRDVRTLRLIGHAASPIPAEIVRRAHATFPGAELAHFYGATETSSVVTVLRHEERVLDTPRLASCGQPVPGVEVEVVGPDELRVGHGEVGEVLVRGPNVMAGYWEDPEATANALHHGWYRTGDLGYLDEQGYLFLVDRAKDMIVSGGENVYSVEVENALYEHPAVLEAAVFGLPDERWGEAVHAVVVVREGTAPTPELAEELRDHCRALIAGYKVPKVVSLRTEPLPQSGPGKILKRQLRDEHAAARAVPAG
jgi:long-chain acyl-CoA synthetase